MKLADGTILEQVNADDIFVTNASLAEMHHKHRVEDEDKDDDLFTQTRHLKPSKDGKMVPAERDPEHPDANARVEDDKKAKKDPSRHVKKTFAAPKKRKDEEKRVNVQEAKDLARRIFEKLQKESV